MNFDELSQEMKDKVKACTTAEEVIQLAQEQGVALSDAQLDAIAGGAVWDDDECDNWQAPCSYVCGTGAVAGVGTTKNGPLGLM